MNTTGKHIIVHKTGEEQAFIIDAFTGQIITPPQERPQWCEGYAAAMLAERTGWYEKRLGTHLPDGLRSPEVVNTADLSWIGVDEAGDEVEIEADATFRQQNLATILEMDTSPEGFDALLDQHKVGAEVDFTYSTHPTDEQTLQEAQGATFAEDAKAASSN